MIAAILTAVLVFVVPWLIVAAFVHGVRFEARRRAVSFDKAAEDVVRLNRRWVR